MSLGPPSGAAALPKPRRYHGTVTLDPARAGRGASKLTDEVLTHLVGLLGSSVRVTLEIDAQPPLVSQTMSSGRPRRTAAR